MPSITLLAKNCFKLAVPLALAACIIRPDAAHAQRVTDSVRITNGDFTIPGRVVSSANQSEFRIDPQNGQIQRTAGDAILFGGPPLASLPMVTITCDRSILSSTNCGRNTVMTVTVSSSSNGRARIGSFDIAPVAGSATFSPMTRNGNQVSFTITFNSNNRPNVASFNLGVSVLITTSGATGDIPLPYTVTISRP